MKPTIYTAKFSFMEDFEKLYKSGWSDWKSFPDPRKGEYINAPLGSGVYQLRNKKTNRYVLFGTSKHLAHRMTSLLPKPYGAGTRNNEDKQNNVLSNIQDIEYRTMSFINNDDAKQFETYIKFTEQYLFNT
ncbi:hypothetical protein [uncultured Bacteroides sp.]|jgi:hypothetical protein|uniref:hypothetical protein n=1 Tax=uncultured Bacteroides sp. TaxID=162156 RepID=UPI000821908C|nr:hypothetical protein [uncultured Bacteroides sp.]SCH90614.1 Uncharacterised protein [uncultured Bacteroides sp.]